MKKNILKIILIIASISSIIANIYFIVKTNNKDEKRILTKEQSKTYEIERKWLVDINNLPFDLKTQEHEEIEQAYLCFEPEIRVRHIGKVYVLDIKSNMTSNGLQREENQYVLKKEDYDKLFQKRDMSTKVISKTRYEIMEKGALYELDVYHNELEGLATVEVEYPKDRKPFESQEEANNFKPASWIGEEVTNDIRYKNGHLAQNGIPKEN